MMIPADPRRSRTEARPNQATFRPAPFAGGDRRSGTRVRGTMGCIHACISIASRGERAIACPRFTADSEVAAKWMMMVVFTAHRPSSWECEPRLAIAEGARAPCLLPLLGLSISAGGVHPASIRSFIQSRTISSAHFPDSPNTYGLGARLPESRARTGVG
jgi:hypothetical protein